jgi:hypothetical protein
MVAGKQVHRKAAKAAKKGDDIHHRVTEKKGRSEDRVKTQPQLLPFPLRSLQLCGKRLSCLHFLASTLSAVNSLPGLHEKILPSRVRRWDWGWLVVGMKTLNSIVVRLDRGVCGVGVLAALGVAAAAACGQTTTMPPGTRQWIHLSANSIAACTCIDDQIGFVAAMPSPSPNYITDPAALAAGRSITAEAASTATTMRARYTRNFSQSVFLRNSFFDTYTIVGPSGTAGQPVAASVTMSTTGELRVDSTAATQAVGGSNLNVEIGTWNPATINISEQFRVNATQANSRDLFIPFAVYTTPQVLPVNITFTADFTPVVGTPFDVAFGNNMSGGGADIASTIVWNLPPGYSITSVLGYNAGSACDSIDFNNNGVFPEDQDVVDFFDVLAGGACGACNDVDFNNNGVFPEDQDVVDFFTVLAGGSCP